MLRTIRCSLRTVPLAVALALAPLAAAGCGTPDISGHRAKYAQARPAPPSLEAGLAEVEKTRNDQDTLGSRILALSLAAENPESAEALYVASRAESDYALIAPNDDERGMATMSALDYAERAVQASGGLAATVSAGFKSEGGGFAAKVLGQYAWAHGSATHLVPMMKRDDHASQTAKLIQRALDADKKQPEALAAYSILERRLADLPIMATAVGSSSLPEGDLDKSLRLAREAVEVRPSVHHKTILVEALLAKDESEEARKVLIDALNAKVKYPRDKSLEPKVKEWLRKLKKEQT